MLNQSPSLEARSGSDPIGQLDQVPDGDYGSNRTRIFLSAIYSFSSSFNALPTTFSTVKPNFSMSKSPGAEAPK
jgi:hypothetical protein